MKIGSRKITENLTAVLMGCWILLTTFALAAAPEASNIRARQFADGTYRVEVVYDLDGAPETGMFVSIALSANGSAPFDIEPAPSALDGDHGPGVTNGVDRRIIWDTIATLPPGSGSAHFKVRLTVSEFCEEVDDEITISVPGSEELEMVRIAAGDFLMGSPASERARVFNEDLHEVHLTRDFYLGKYEVTQAQWRSVMGSNPARYHGVGDDFPIYYISWNDIAGPGGFIERVNQFLSTEAFRLPTEAEWEYAARAGTQTRFSHGDALQCDDACGFCGAHDAYMVWCGNAGLKSENVGTKLPNAFGLYDMHGNVNEWVQDLYQTHLGTSEQWDPVGPATGNAPVVRGGSWSENGDASRARSAARMVWGPFAMDDIGFRLARTGCFSASVDSRNFPLELPETSSAIAGFAWTPQFPDADQVVSFSDTSVGAPSSWHWEFGDGDLSELQNPSHWYESEGMYQVTLTATNDSGSGSVTHDVIVANAGSTGLLFRQHQPNCSFCPLFGSTIADSIDHVGLVARGRVWESHPGYPGGLYCDSSGNTIAISDLDGVQNQHSAATFAYDAALPEEWQTGDVLPLSEVDLIDLVPLDRELALNLDRVIREAGLNGDAGFNAVNWQWFGAYTPAKQKGEDGMYSAVGLIEWAAETAGLNGGEGFILDHFENVYDEPQFPLLTPALLRFFVELTEEQVQAGEAENFVQGMIMGAGWIVTDPFERRLGYTVDLGIINEIPGAFLGGDGYFWQYLIPDAIPGIHRIDIHGRGARVRGANGTGEYSRTIDETISNGEIDSRSVYVSTPGLDDISDNVYIIPATAYSVGEANTMWKSDVEFFNVGAEPASVRMYFLPPGGDNSASEGRSTVGFPESSVPLDNIVLNTFGQSRMIGAVLFDSTQPLVISSRTFNRNENGTYGQFVPGIFYESTLGFGEVGRLVQLTQNQDFRTNFGFSNASANPVEISVQVYDSHGDLIHERDYHLDPYGFFQTGSVIPDDVDDAFAVVFSNSADAHYMAYASVVDRNSGDPILVLPQIRSTRQGEEVYVAASAHGRGNENTIWRTDLEVHNPGAILTTYRIDLLRTDHDNSEPEFRVFSLNAGQSIRYEDVLMGVFSYEGTAALRISPEAGELMVTSRTYNLGEAMTFGQYVPGLTQDRVITPDRPGELIQLSQSVSSSSGYRTNIGFVNLVDSTTEAELILRDGYGVILGRVTVELLPFEHRQLNSVFLRVSDSGVSSGTTQVRILTQDAQAAAYASVIDNLSGDPVFAFSHSRGGGR